jgi:hypothetical protein
MIESDLYYNAIRSLAQYITMRTEDMTGDEYECQLAYELEHIYEHIDNAVWEMRNGT